MASASGVAALALKRCAMAGWGRGRAVGTATMLAAVLALGLGGCGSRLSDSGAAVGTSTARPSAATIPVAATVPLTAMISARAPTSPTGTTVNDPHPAPTRPMPPPGSVAPAPGVPAILPTKPSAGPDDPAFTEEDARAYVDRRGHDDFRMVAIGPTTIDRILFVRGADAGYPDYPLLCLVSIRGEYQLVGGPPPRPGDPPRTPITSNGLTLIFDAHTGNELGSGGSLWATPVPHQ